MFCPKCGNQVPDEAAFCSKCGNKLERPKAGGSVASPAVDAHKAASPLPSFGGAQLDNKKVGLLAAAVVVVILIILAIVTGGFGLMGGSSSSSGSGSADSGYSSGSSSADSGYSNDYSDSSAGSGTGIRNINELNEALKNGDLDDQIYGSGSGSRSGSGNSKTVRTFSEATGLSIDGSRFNKSGNMWNFSGTLRNSSSTYTYKDVKIKLSLMSGGLSVGSTVVTLDMRNSTDSLRPNSTTPININVDYSGSVSDVQVDLVSATQISN